jgi:hypothetical protein
MAKEQAKLARQMSRESILADPRSRGKLPCFAGETLVATTHGPQRIDRLRAGDPVWTFDFDSGTASVRRVTQTHLSRSDRLVTIDLDGATVRATATHRFWVEDGMGWTLAHSLRPGMRVRGLDHHPLEIRATSTQDTPAEPTFNLSIDGTATFFVGPGVLVHNAPVDVGLGGQFIIYRAVNRVASEFAGKTYIGQTTEVSLKLTPRGTVSRGGEHRSAALRVLAEHEAAIRAGEPGLKAEQEMFYRFMKDAELEPLVKGIGTKAQADYLEQLNIELDRKVYGADNVMNRREQIAREAHMEAIVQEILKDEKVAKLYCPTG